MSYGKTAQYNKRRRTSFSAGLEYPIMNEISWQVHQDLESLPVVKL